MQKVIPTLRITNHELSRTFYETALGFKVDWEHRFGSTFPVFMQVSREGMILYLSEHEGDCQPGGLVHLYVPNVDSWYSELKDRGVEVQPPRNQPWGNRDMRISDPDGNSLCICTQLRD